jgi:hypothetical protein
MPHPKFSLLLDEAAFLGLLFHSTEIPGFDSFEFEGIKNEAGRNSFFLSAKKWIVLTGAKVLIPSAGRYGGTYAHKDIAFEFGSWLSTELKLYLIKEFHRLKDDEIDCLKLGWERLLKLNEIDFNQMRTLLSANNVKRLK